MSLELETQIRDYADFLEETQAQITVEETMRRADPMPAIPDQKPPRGPRKGWRIALAVSLGVIVFVLNLLLGGLRTETEPAVSTTLPPPLSNGWIAYSSPDEDEDNLFISDRNIFITRAGESPSRIFGAPGDGVDQTCPTFSPDGSKLAYAEGPSHAGGESEAASLSREIVVVAFDGSYDELLRVKVTPVNGGCITWSPDSTMIAYPLATGGIQIGGLDGESHILEGLYPRSNASDFVPYFYAELAWSPDGSSIAGVSGASLFTVSFDGGEPVELARNGNWDSSSLAWSPDGSLIAVRWNTNPSPQTIHIIAADGSEVRSFEANQTDQWYENHSDAWSPDGTRLAYLDLVLNSIAVLDPETGDVTHLTLDPFRHGLQAGPIWSADGSHLLVATTDRETNDAAFVTVPVDPDQEPVVLQVLEQPLVDGLNGLSWQTIQP